MGCGKKQAAMMAMFVTKKPAAAPPTIADAAAAQSSAEVSRGWLHFILFPPFSIFNLFFDKDAAPVSRFKPFQLHQDMTLAPVLRLAEHLRPALATIDAALGWSWWLKPMACFS
jgi:hypothetical protein